MRYLIPIFILFFFQPTYAQKMNDLYSHDWKKADSLLQNGFPESAIKIINSIYTKAKQQGATVQIIKAELFLLSANFERSEDAYKTAITTTEGYIQQSKFPVKNIWQSIAAQLYWNYYQQNRWKVLERTSVSNETTLDDLEQWDAKRFFDKVSMLYKESLSQPKALEKIDISIYDPILIKSVNTQQLRPTLYDLLAFRALAYFENEEKDLNRPSFAFTLKDATVFSNAQVFIKTTFATEDSSSLQHQALQIYQTLLSIHKDDIQPEAFIDADLARLAFAYQYSTVANKKDAYLKALETIQHQYAAYPISGIAAVKMANVLLERKYERHTRGSKTSTNHQTQDAKTILEVVVQKFPKSEASIQAQNLLQDIKRKELHITVEEVIIPNEPSKFLLQYKNVNQVFLKVIAINNQENFWKGLQKYSHNDEAITSLLQAPVIKQWSETLLGNEDYELHRTEVKIDKLPVGMYVLMVSTDKQFRTANNLLSHAMFQVSNLSVVQHSANNMGYVLHRKTGEPLSDIQISFYKQQYNNKNREYEPVKQGATTSGSDGSFKIDNNNISYLKLSRQEDAVFINGNYYSTSEESTNQETVQTLIFTDRSIYRPGQTIYFKGIVFKSSNNGKTNTVFPNHSTIMKLYDANGQEVSKQNFRTNEFGSFTGSFTAPDGLLTGYMSLSNESGSASISVEEYKRPKFYVTLDTLKKSYTLGELISSKGTAMAYAGNPIDGAKVSYRVVRTSRFPYPWLCYFYRYVPQQEEMEIANGTTTTDAQGHFNIDFQAIPDESIQANTLPVFNYTITATVTDINGETHSNTQSIHLGYSDLELSVAAPEVLTKNSTSAIKVNTMNLNGVYLPAKASIKITLLQQPATVLRKRLWETPDVFIIDSLTFKKDFPNDVYKDEDDYRNWQPKKQLIVKSFTTNKEGTVPLPAMDWEEGGWYEIAVTTTDKKGTTITEKKYAQVINDHYRTSNALTLINEQAILEPGATLTTQLISGYQKLHVLQLVKDMDGLQPMQQLSYNNKPIVWKKLLTEKDRGGLLVNYLTVKENRVYTEQAFINVPWTNKDLHISWETHRDKLLPGATETWTMVIRGHKKEKVAAELAATLYDASLDALKAHQWSWYSLFPSLSTYYYWNTQYGFQVRNGITRNSIQEKYIESLPKHYADIDKIPSYYNYGRYDVYKSVRATSMSEAMPMAADGGAKKEIAAAPSKNESNRSATSLNNNSIVASQEKNTDISVRKNLQETAFFYPQLKTDEEGNIRLTFTMPEALTEWKLMAFAHTKDMSTGFLEGRVKTQKELMVVPNLPRFLRQGDKMTLSTKVVNLSTKALTGKAKISIKNALTGQTLDLPFRISSTEKSFVIAAQQSTNITWELAIPESIYVPVTITLTAQAGDFTDGEENTLPVITNRMLVTETLPLWMNGEGKKQYQLEHLLASTNSKTISPHRLTLEYTANPAWYAIQALPYMMEYPYECAEQTFNRYYATTLAAFILEKAPKVKAIFEQWKKDGTNLTSPLFKNQELKSALLQETPWVMEAQSETEQMQRVGQLFDSYRLSKERKSTLKKLMDQQHPDGSFGWFDGMRADRYITQYIVTGLAKLKYLGVSDQDGDIQSLINRALPYLDHELTNDYHQLKRNKTNLDNQTIGYTQVQYLYLRSFLKDAPKAVDTKIIQYYTQQADKYWTKFNAFSKGMIALTLYRQGNTTTPKSILQSLQETSIYKEELGRFWVTPGASYWWYDAPIETQSLLIECFNEITSNQEMVNQMKRWLLKNKQTNRWETTKATADACYALLVTGSNWLESSPQIIVTLGNTRVNSLEEKTQAGSGYFKTSWQGKDIQPSMGNIVVTVSNQQKTQREQRDASPSWGAVYWQYFEDMDKITAAKTSLIVNKQLFIEKNTIRGPELTAITEKNSLQIGDKVMVRLTLTTDRDLEYVHLKDMRAACFEPANVLSSYKYKNGLGFYESTKDISTNFFFDRLPKGTYVLEYPVYIQQKGSFSSGIASLQCMYAPEFSSHSEGIKITVH